MAWSEFNSHSLVTKCDIGSKIIYNNKQLDQRPVGIQWINIYILRVCEVRDVLSNNCNTKSLNAFKIYSLLVRLPPFSRGS